MNRENVTDLWSLDARLAALGRGVGAMRLRIGEALVKLESLGGVHALGFPTLESYTREALGRSGRWGGDARALARRLQVLPALRAALISGGLKTSMVELVVRVAVEAMLAEGLGVLLARDPDLDLPATIGGAYESESEALTRAELALLHERCEAAAESAVPPRCGRCGRPRRGRRWPLRWPHQWPHRRPHR